MVYRDLIVSNEMGLHVRPASLLVRIAAKYESSIQLESGGYQINGKSIIQILSACLSQGKKIRIVCDGPDEKELLDEITELFESNFQEN